jgi:hypothetical protein
MSWTGHVARTGKLEIDLKFQLENLKERDNFIDLRVYGNRVGGCGLDSSGSGYELVASSCVHDNESWVSIKEGGIS